MSSRAPAVSEAQPPKQRLTDQKRASIVRSAAAEFQARGFDGTSMDQIAAHAGVSKRTVYNHFPSKEDLFHEIVAELTARADLTTSFPFDGELSIEEQLVAIGDTILGVMEGDDFVKLARVVLSRFLHSPDLAAHMLGKGQHPFRVGLIKWIRAASADGMLQVSDPEMAARQFVALLNVSAFWPQVLAAQPPLSPAEREVVLRSTVSMFLDHYVK